MSALGYGFFFLFFLSLLFFKLSNYLSLSLMLWSSLLVFEFSVSFRIQSSS